MKIANWNLARVLPSHTRSHPIREYMADVAADLWILTETHEELSPGVGFSGVFSGEPDQPSKTGERWVGIWSRHRVEPLNEFVSDAARGGREQFLAILPPYSRKSLLKMKGPAHPVRMSWPQF